MRVLYGVAGEGMGHATRSRVVLDQLVGEHEVHIVTSGRAREYLAQHFPHVHGIWGLTLAYDDNVISRWQTVVQNLRGSISGWPRNVAEYYRLVEEFEPDVVITDFEAFATLFAKRHRLPLISLDNIQIVDRCAHDPALIESRDADFWLARRIISMKVPRAEHYLVTTFFYPPIRRRRTTLVPPLLRSEILGAASEPGEHLLVYQTASGNDALPDVLSQAGVPCRIYGFRRDLNTDVVEGALTYRPFSEAGFVDDLRTARAVVAGGGFTLLSEAVYLGKPVLSIPIDGQFEQVLNAVNLEQLGYGVHASEATVDSVGEFLERLPDCRRALAAYHQDGNEASMAALRKLLLTVANGEDSPAETPTG